MSKNNLTGSTSVAPSLAANPAFYTIDEVAQMLKCTRRHLQRLIAKGKIRVIKLGTSSRIDSQVLAEDLAVLTAAASNR